MIYKSFPRLGIKTLDDLGMRRRKTSTFFFDISYMFLKMLLRHAECLAIYSIPILGRIPEKKEPTCKDPSVNWIM